ncbi:MAG: hypothetical protein ACKVZ6_18000 [Kineosporiaceae bacterium]
MSTRVVHAADRIVLLLAAPRGLTTAIAATGHSCGPARGRATGDC